LIENKVKHCSWDILCWVGGWRGGMVVAETVMMTLFKFFFFWTIHYLFELDGLVFSVCIR
jgi:hypothetical protein